MKIDKVKYKNYYERDTESGLDYAHARYRDINLGFISTDQMWWRSPDKTSYHYSSNNPIMSIDHDGMDDYTVNEKGKITLSQKTDDKTDRLIVLGKNGKIEYDEDGKMTNTSYEVNKGILNNQKKLGVTTYMYVTGNDQAEGLFEFLSDNTTVEWGRVSYGNSSNYISTNNHTLDNGIESIVYEKFSKTNKINMIKLIDHSHPNLDFVNPLPSGFPETPAPAGTGDKAFADWLYKYYPTIAPNVILRVYNGQKYKRYNNKRIFK